MEKIREFRVNHPVPYKTTSFFYCTRALEGRSRGFSRDEQILPIRPRIGLSVCISSNRTHIHEYSTETIVADRYLLVSGCNVKTVSG